MSQGTQDWVNRSAGLGVAKNAAQNPALALASYLYLGSLCLRPLLVIASSGVGGQRKDRLTLQPLSLTSQESSLMNKQISKQTLKKEDG